MKKLTLDISILIVWIILIVELIRWITVDGLAQIVTQIMRNLAMR